jgi:hypothetical protein
MEKNETAPAEPTELQQQPTNDARLPRLRHTIKLSEEDGTIVLDISDETGGLGLKLYFNPIEAENIARDIYHRAQDLKGKDDA